MKGEVEIRRFGPHQARDRNPASSKVLKNAQMQGARNPEE
jgi:hypothetical protein